MVRWCDTFWGEGNRGFEVLSTNVKNGALAIEEFQRFLTESSQYESTYCKNLSRLQAQFSKNQHVGTFTPIWHSIRDLLEKIAAAHTTTITYYQDLLREVHNYQESYQKKVKTSIQKDPDITRTTELISQLNNALNTVNKAKEQYHSIGLDYERAKRTGTNVVNGTSTPVPTENPSLAQTAFNTLTSNSRQIERLEKKYRQSHDDYRTSIDKYNSLRNEFEKRFYDACIKFQDFEGDHVQKMLHFAVNYGEILKLNNEQTRTAQNEFHEKIKQFTCNDLIDAFVEQKKTGTERPISIQFEEIDHIKTSDFNTTTAPPPPTSEELIIFDPIETVPNYFPVSSPTSWSSTSNMKKSDSNRALATNSTSNHPHFSTTNQSTSSLFNNTPMSLSNPNNPLARLQETNNDPISNPFDVKIRRPAFKAFWPSNRKEKKEKKDEKKRSNNSKTTTKSQTQEETNSIHSQQSGFETNDFHQMIGSIDGLDRISSNMSKGKCPTPEPYTQSSPTISSSSINRPGCQSTIPFSSSAMRKSTSSSDSSDDDEEDAFPISKIKFKINETSQQSPIAEESDETKISNAMRAVDKNLGHFATCSRTTGRKFPDISKSISVGRIPPPVPSRPPSTLSTSITTDNFGTSSPPLINTYEVMEARRKSMTVSSNHQENIPPLPPHPRSFTMSTEPKKSIDDDNEVANSFPVDKIAPFAVPRPPRARPSLSQTFSSLSKIENTRSDFVRRKKLFHLRSSLIARIRSIWKSSIQQTPIVFRKLSPTFLRHQISVNKKSSLGFLTKQNSIQSFHTARESLSEQSIHSSHICQTSPIEQQQPTISSSGPSIANGRTTPFIAPNSQSFSNGLLTSLDARMSPLTIGATDQLPIAVAFQETIHVMMSGDDQTRWKVRILGDMLISFPAAILNILMDPSPHLNTLEFRLQNLHKVENVIANPQLVAQSSSSMESDGPIYSFNMSTLSNTLRNLQEKNRSLPFFNFGVLKYEVKHSGISNIPIQVSSQCTRTLDTISIHINYRFNSSALPELSRLANDMVTFHTNLLDGQQIQQSSPMAEWSLTEHKLSWKIPYIFDGSGTLSATVTINPSTSNGNENEHGPRPLSTSPIVHVQFLAENALFSGIDFEFACRGYRVSLLKKKICSGKYQSESEQTSAVPFVDRPSVDQHHLSLSTPLVA